MYMNIMKYVYFPCTCCKWEILFILQLCILDGRPELPTGQHVSPGGGKSNHSQELPQNAG